MSDNNNVITTQEEFVRQSKNTQKIKIFGYEFKYIKFDAKFDVFKNIKINNENFALVGAFLKLIEAEMTKLRNSIMISKDIFSLDFNRYIKNGLLYDVNDRLKIKRIAEGEFVLYFYDFKDLQKTLIQFSTRIETETTDKIISKVNFNYNLIYDEDKNVYNKMQLKFDNSDVKLLQLIII